MSGSIVVRRGAHEIERLLRESPLDLRTVERDRFRAWLERELPRWRRDPVVQRREAIRYLRRAHPRLVLLESELRQARAADEASSAHAPLARLERELQGVTRAIEGLSRTAAEAKGERRDDLAAKLGGFRRREAELRRRRQRLIAESAERRRLMAVEEELSNLRAAVGLESEEARLAEFLAERGRGSGRSGADFEAAAVEAARAIVMAELDDGSGVRLLRGVKLGAAAMELDQVVVRPGAPGELATALAVIEAKRNPNDLGGGFRQRQLNLAWLTGDRTAYDPTAHRTRRFPTGHFDRVVAHAQDGEDIALGPGSFAQFHRDPGTGFFLDRLYFVTRPGTLLGASAAALSRIRHRVATDLRFALDDDRYLADLLSWGRTLLHPVEAPDVLRAYSSSAERATRILFLQR